MNKNKLLGLLIGITALTQVCYAQEKTIEGAFGYKFGDTFNSSHLKRVAIGGSDMYQIKPLNPYVAFSEYYVLPSPKTQKIQSIYARGYYKTLNACVDEYKVLLMYLKDKYDAFEDPVALLKDGYGITARRGSSSIATMCQQEDPSNNKSRAVLSILYTNETVTATAADKETKARLFKKVDPSGL